MAGGVNKVILIGNLGADPEVRFTPGGQAVANFRIATSESWTDKNGQKQERTEWHRIVVWGKLAELCGEYLKKGRQCYVEGRLQTREWTDKENRKNYTTEVVANAVTFLGGRDAGEGMSAGGGGGGGAGRAPPRVATATAWTPTTASRPPWMTATWVVATAAVATTTSRSEAALRCPRNAAPGNETGRSPSHWGAAGVSSSA